jgi:hypothetical protein
MTLAAKAARGAGAPSAQAANYGRAAVRHLCSGRAEDDLRLALITLPEGPILALPLKLTECEAGILESDGWDALARSYVEALPFEASLDADMNLVFDLAHPARHSVPARCELPMKINSLWCDLAAKTLVPESDASRISGAGAGLSDND